MIVMRLVNHLMLIFSGNSYGLKSTRLFQRCRYRLRIFPTPDELTFLFLGSSL